MDHSAQLIPIDPGLIGLVQGDFDDFGFNDYLGGCGFLEFHEIIRDLLMLLGRSHDGQKAALLMKRVRGRPFSDAQKQTEILFELCPKIDEAGSLQDAVGSIVRPVL